MSEVTKKMETKELKQEVKKGDVFETSWGYDQTNYDFIVVEEISPSGKTALCKRAYVKYVSEESHLTQDALRPTKESYGLPFRMRIERPQSKHFKGQVWLRGSYPFLSRFEEDWSDEQKKGWLKSKRLDSFSKVEPDRSYFQTNSMFGH